MDIAKEILNQLKYPNIAVMWSWGANKFQALHAYDGILGGLEFGVSGRKFKGRVVVKLMPSDTYRVEFLGHGRKLKHAIDDVYCDELTMRIDEIVET